MSDICSFTHELHTYASTTIEKNARRKENYEKKLDQRFRKAKVVNPDINASAQNLSKLLPRA